MRESTFLTSVNYLFSSQMSHSVQSYYYFSWKICSTYFIFLIFAYFSIKIEFQSHIVTDSKTTRSECFKPDKVQICVIWIINHKQRMMINFLVKRCFPNSFIQGTPRLRAGNHRKDNNVFNRLSLASMENYWIFFIFWSKGLSANLPTFVNSMLKVQRR